jgi:hypothetical protein
MYKLVLIDSVKEDSINDIAIHNMKIADERYNIDLFILASVGWFQANRNKNFKDLETFCRENKFNTHFFAKEKKYDVKLFIPNNDNKMEYKYEVVYSCRPKDVALKEVLENWKTYDENFQVLSTCGSRIYIDDNITETDSENKNPALEIMYNKKKITFVEITLEDLKKDIKKLYQQYPVSKLVGLHKTGGPIFGLYVGDKLVSDIGYTIYYNNENQVIELINLDNLS